MKNKSILVLLSTYNGKEYITDQINSILNQKSDYIIHLLVRDDGSKDSTIKILEKFRNDFPERVKIIKGTNKGYISSFFELIKVANGYDYYSLSDQDDIWLPNKLDSAVNACESLGFDGPILYGSSSFLVYDDHKIVGETQKKRKEITLFNTLIQNILPGHTQVFNNELCVILKTKFKLEQIYVHDAWITNIAMLYGKIIFDNRSYTYYRQHNKNQIGYGRGIYGWIQERFRRLQNNDNFKYANQIKYFYDEFHAKIDKEIENELFNFFNCQTSFLRRLNYILKTKFYRQKKMETFLFKILYLIGGYNTTITH